MTNASEVVDAPPVAPSASPLGAAGDDQSAADPLPDAGAGRPAPGELGIKERRSWHTWQLFVFGLVCLLLGMLITWTVGGGTSTTAPPSTKSSATLPPQAGSPTTIPASSATTQAPAASNSTPPTSTAPVTTTTAGVAQVLLGPTPQTHGNWTSAPFTVGSGTWSIGWAFQCTPAPASGPSFLVFVYPSGGKVGTTPAVNESGASGKSVTTQASTGSQLLHVNAPANCIWIVKVTGVP